MEKIRKAHLQPVKLSIYPGEKDKPLLQFSDSIHRMRMLDHAARKARTELQHEALANLLIELS